MTMRNLIALISGCLFGLGLTLSQMVDPMKILAFLDVAGDWNPAMMFVIGGALAVYLPVALWASKRSTPIADKQFHLPTAKQIDAPLLGGAAIFGIGWGLAGFCPAPVVASLPGGEPQVLAFVAAMAAGLALGRVVKPRLALNHPIAATAIR